MNRKLLSVPDSELGYTDEGINKKGEAEQPDEESPEMSLSFPCFTSYQIVREAFASSLICSFPFLPLFCLLGSSKNFFIIIECL